MNLTESYALALSVATQGAYYKGFTPKQVETINDMLKVINLELFWKKEDELKQQEAEFTANLLKVEQGIDEMAQGFLVEIESLKAQLAQYQSADCVLVPKGPTVEMIVSGLDTIKEVDSNKGRYSGSVTEIYIAMIEAQE